MFGSCVQGIKVNIQVIIDTTVINTFLGKRKPWSGILLYGVRHLCYMCMCLQSLLVAVVVVVVVSRTIMSSI